MSKRYLNEADIRSAVIGGGILGGGGGGPVETGLQNGLQAVAYRDIELLSADELDDNALVATCAVVGAPSAPGFHVMPSQHVRAISNFIDFSKHSITGIITNENGGTTTTNGMMQAAVLGIPLIDAPCNGRAHPTGTMGSMGLGNVPGYMSVQSFCGGRGDGIVEGVVKAPLGYAAKVVRQASVAAGGGVAVCRNTVTGAYLRKNAAVGAIAYAIDLGKAWQAGITTSATAAIAGACAFLHGSVIARGAVSGYQLVSEGGLDVGHFEVDGVKLGFLNEYLYADSSDGSRLATFPDMIATVDLVTGLPVNTNRIADGCEVAVIAAPAHSLKLGAGMFDRALFEEVESMTGFELVKYLSFKVV